MVVVPKHRLGAWSRDVDAGMGGAAERLGRGVRSFASARRVGPRVSVGPLAHGVTRAAVPGAILAGDAAGFVDPFTAAEDAYFPETFGDFVKAYEQVAVG